MKKEKGLEDKSWVIDYITKWIEKNTKFKVQVLKIAETTGSENRGEK